MTYSQLLTSEEASYLVKQDFCLTCAQEDDDTQDTLNDYPTHTPDEWAMMEDELQEYIHNTVQY